MANKDLATLWASSKSLIKIINDEVKNKINNRVVELAKAKKSAESNDPEDFARYIQLAKSSLDLNPSKDTLAPLTNLFSDVISGIMAYMTLKSNTKMYAYMLFYSEIIVDYKYRGFCSIDVNKSPMIIHINPLFVKDEWSPSDVVGVFTNEMLKIIYLHPDIYKKVNTQQDPQVHLELDIASDIASSEIVIDKVINDIKSGNNATMRLPDNIYTKSRLERNYDMNLQNNADIKYYYAAIASKRSKLPEQDGTGANQGMAMPQSENGTASPENSQGKQAHDWESGNPENSHNNMLGTIGKAIDAVSKTSSDGRGLIPSWLQSQIDDLFKPPKINWRQYLRKAIGMIPVPYEETKRKLNRRQMKRPDLPGRKPKMVSEVVVALDTSGSMSDGELSNCLNEVCGIVKSAEANITVIECDAEISKKPYTIKPKQKNRIQRNMSGRGGTSFIPVIEYINANKRYRNSVLIYFTDGYGDYEIPKPKVFRTIWVVLRDKDNLSLKEPYGQVVTLDLDDDIFNN